VVLGLVGHRDGARDVNVAFSFGTFVAACALTAQVIDGGPMLVWEREFYIDALNVFLVTLTAFVGLTTAIFSRPYMRIERDHGKMTPPRLRLYHSMYQLFSFTMLLALTTNNLGIDLGGHGGGHADHRAAGQRLPHGRQPGGRLEVLHPVRRGHRAGLVRHGAAVHGGREGHRARSGSGGALLWTNLDAVKTQLDPNIITLAFAFLFIGYGTKVGLVPVHNWLPDAHAEGPTPVSAVLSGLLLNVALYAVLRCKVLTDGALGSTGCRAS
jgi:hydrogenase-4 component F